MNAVAKAGKAKLVDASRNLAKHSGARPARRPRYVSERLIQRALFDHIGWRKNPGWLFWSTPNGGKRSLSLGADLKRQGMTAGIGDVSALSPVGGYYELELKAEYGRLSPAQRERLEALRTSGCQAEVAYGLDDALAKLIAWGAIR